MGAAAGGSGASVDSPVAIKVKRSTRNPVDTSQVQKEDTTANTLELMLVLSCIIASANVIPPLPGLFALVDEGESAGVAVVDYSSGAEPCCVVASC